ncbi:hypothetical protein ACFOZ7_15585 [Natribaculum luteum]|uniref:DUF8119 domain-containing protein n=1 Tax=Natribaculum luteum TaxID=1586232 RepID=A0ABD5P1Z9_9EURY|nr:hypothetical protein [Natribaculum luteum]
MTDRDDPLERTYAYYRLNRKHVLRDVSVALLWTGAVAYMIDQLDWPIWSFFVIYFGMWYLYLQVIPSWNALD